MYQQLSVHSAATSTEQEVSQSSKLLKHFNTAIVKGLIRLFGYATQQVRGDYQSVIPKKESYGV